MYPPLLVDSPRVAQFRLRAVLSFVQHLYHDHDVYHTQGNPILAFLILTWATSSHKQNKFFEEG